MDENKDGGGGGEGTNLSIRRIDEASIESNSGQSDSHSNLAETRFIYLLLLPLVSRL